MTRHASVHAAGVVIAPRPLTEFAPLYKSAEGRNRHAVGDEGGRARRPPEDGLPRPQHADADRRRARRDQAHRGHRRSTSTPSRSTTRRPTSCSCDGQTYGVFQFESSGMRELLRKAKPERLDDLIALNALYRPGPLKGGMVDDYIIAQAGARPRSSTSCRSSSRSSPTPTASSPTRNRSCASPRVLAGFTMGQSDVLRKAMGKKDPKVMAKQREAFMSGALANGVNEKKAKQDLRPDGVLRRVRLQQVALDDLRAASRTRPRTSRRTTRATSWRRC